MRNFAFIFARGGSKGLPGKNIKPLAGKPLLQYSIDTALASDLIEQVLFQQMIRLLHKSL